MSKKKDIESPLEVGLKFWLKMPIDSKRMISSIGSKSKKKQSHSNFFSVGPGDIKLLKTLFSGQNLTQAAETCGYSYKYAWQKLQKIAKESGKQVIKTHRGGVGGGGTVEVTSWGVYLIKQFERIESKLKSTILELNEYLKEHTFNE